MGAKDQLAVNTIRMLSAEAIQKAKSGHPGLPMGAAPMAWALFSRCLKHSPGNPGWVDRDRFILSAGHGSMLLYSLLHLFGYGITIEDIKNFRQWGSPCAGHPEYGLAKGIETTTGPLGQGLANAVGFAIAEAHLAAKFNRESYDIVSHNTYVLVSDGCMMEGVTAEASSLAGMLKLSKLIVLYDSNDVTIEGSTGMAFTEDVGRRYEAYGWNVLKVSEGNDIEKITRAIEKAKRSDRPTLIIVKTQIAYGSPLEGSARSHGEPLGEENIRLTREKLCYGCPPFTVPDEVSKMMKILKKDADKHEARWDALFERYEKAHPILAAEWKAWHSGALPEGLEDDASLFNFGGASIVSTRTASGEVLNKLAAKMPNIIGGSADLGPSNKSVLNGKEYIKPGNFSGQNIHYGVREFAMAAIANGIALHGGLRTYVATFLVFTDYLKAALRSAAMMRLPVIFIATHDSIGMGEDGPTHQPVEHLAMMRAMPGCTVIRPADANETAAAYLAALRRKGPTVLALARQDVPVLSGTGKGLLKGGYVLRDCKDPDIVLLATGSEVKLICGAADVLAEKGVKARVVSLPCFEIFDEQDEPYKESVLGKGVKRLAVEAATSFGWHKYVGDSGDIIALDHFGASAPSKILFEKFGFTVENVVERAIRLIGR